MRELHSNYYPDLLHKKEGPPWWAVLLLFIPIIRLSLLNRRRAYADEYTAIDIYAIIDIVVFLVSVVVLVLRRREIPWRKIVKSSFLWWIIYYVFCLFSIFWRIQGSSIPYICYRASAMIVMSLYTTWLLNKFKDSECAFQQILKYIFAFGCLGLLRAIKAGDLHTNSYSVMFAIVAIILLTMREYLDKKLYKIMLVASIFLFLLGTSAGTNVAFACTFILLLYQFPYKLSLRRGIAGAVIGYILYAYAMEYLFEILFPGKSMRGVLSMTGRMRIWTCYFEAWKLHPWLGYGFPVGERSGLLFGYIYCSSAHNGYLSLLINTGIFGMLIWNAFFVPFFIELYRNVKQRRRFAYPIFLAMILICINNMSVPIIGSQWGMLPQAALFLIVFDMLFLNKQEKRYLES